MTHLQFGHMTLKNSRDSYYTLTTSTPQLNLTTHAHKKSVNFLDTTIYINSNNKLKSDVYIKPTDRTLLLNQNSSYPQTCKNSIIYSQAIRYIRITTNSKKLQQRLDSVLISLMHKHDNIITSFNKALLYTHKMTYLTKQKMQIKQLTDQSSQLNTTVILSKCIHCTMANHTSLSYITAINTRPIPKQ